MKKISTVGARQSKNFPDQKLTIGLDLGDRSSWYCVLDGAGEVLLEQRLGTTPTAMKEVFGRMPRSRMALETGMHSPWVSRVERKNRSLKSADGRVATVVTRRGEEPCLTKNKRIHLAPTGLLMEGDFAH